MLGKRMNILLVFPRVEHGQTTIKDKGSWNALLFGNPIITLPHIAGITPKEHDVKIVNENYNDINFDVDVDLIGITCYTMTAPRVYKIADEFRKRGKTVVLGGYHPTALPEEAKKHADSVILGMAEASWPKLAAFEPIVPIPTSPIFENGTVRTLLVDVLIGQYSNPNLLYTDV